MRQKEEMEELLIENLQKLIMLSIDRRIPPKKIGHIRSELGLPDEFRMNLVKKYWDDDNEQDDDSVRDWKVRGK